MKRLILLLAVTSIVQLSYAQDPFDKAKSALAQRDTNSAITFFKEAVKVGRKTSESNTYLGAFALARHHVDEAIGYCQAAIDRDNENIEAYKVLGYALLEKKDFAGALTQFRRAVKLAPKDISISQGYGTALLAADSVDAAIVQLSRAKETSPNNPALYNLLAEAYLKQNVYVLGESNYQKAIELEPSNIATRAKLARVYYKEKKYVESVKEWEGIVAIDSTLTEPYIEIGRTYLLAKIYRNAVRPLYKLTQLQPKSVEGWSMYARTLFGGDDFADAAKAAQTSLKLDSTSEEIWRVLARSLTKTKDWNGALVGFAGLKRHGKLNAEDLGDYGACLTSVGREDEAIQVLLEAIKADSTNCDVYFPLGFIYMKRHDYEHAAGMFEKRIVCDPRSLSTYVNGAACYMALKNWPRCRQLLVRSIELKPDYLAGHLYLGRYYAQVDSLDQAVSQYDTVLALDRHRHCHAQERSRRGVPPEGPALLPGQAVRAGRSRASGRPRVRGSRTPPSTSCGDRGCSRCSTRRGTRMTTRGRSRRRSHTSGRPSPLIPASRPPISGLGRALSSMRMKGTTPGTQKLVEEACSGVHEMPPPRAEERGRTESKGTHRL